MQFDIESVATATLLLAGAVAVALFGRARKDSLPSPVPQTRPKPPGPQGGESVATRPNEQLPILDAQALLDKVGMQGMVGVIRNRLGLTRENFERDALPALHRFAEFAQLLPASESHHHAQPGGLLIHTLEVTSFALTLRQGYKLPVGAAPEDQIRLAPAWTFAVMLAALLHDVGKPVSDVLVQLFGDNPRQPLGQWQPLSGAMGQTPGATHYLVDFPEQKNYAAHQRLGVALLHALVGSHTLHWLSSDPQLLAQLIAYLDGVSDSPLAEIVSKADSLSVAKNLKEGTRVRFARAKQPPLIERLMWGLRTLVSEGHLPCNRPGAALFIDPDGAHLWLVSATVADRVRTLLDEREKRHGGAALIPSDNTRLFDTWQEYGALVPPPKDYGKGSVWWVRIDMPSQSPPWSQVLTVLKFPIDAVYEPGASIPAPLRGSITPVAPSSREQRSGAESVAADDTGPEAPEPLLVAYDDRGRSLRVSVPASVSINPGQGTPEDAAQGAAPDQELGGDYLDSSDSAGQAVSENQDQHAKGAHLPGLRTVAPVQAFTLPTVPPQPKNKAHGAMPRPNAEAFMLWIQQGLGTGELSYNESDSIVHFTPEGMGIVTPKAFKMYLEDHPYQGDLGESKTPMNALQRDIQKGGYTSRHKATKSSFHKYRVRQSDGKPGTAVITTYIIPNPQAYIRPVPSPNPLLLLEVGEGTGRAEQTDARAST